MKRVLLTCLALATFAAARPSLQVDRERIEAGQTFGLQFIVPLQELPANREVVQIETKNGFTFAYCGSGGAGFFKTSVKFVSKLVRWTVSVS